MGDPVEDRRVRALVHAINNLLGTIEVQAELALAAPDADAARRALEIVRRAGRSAERRVRALRAGEADGEPSW